MDKSLVARFFVAHSVHVGSVAAAAAASEKV